MFLLSGVNFTSSNLAIKSRKHPKTFVVQKVKVQLITATRCLKKFRLGVKNFDDQARSARLKTVDSEAVHKAIEANPVKALGEY